MQGSKKNKAELATMVEDLKDELDTANARIRYLEEELKKFSLNSRSRIKLRAMENLFSRLANSNLKCSEDQKHLSNMVDEVRLLMKED